MFSRWFGVAKRRALQPGAGLLGGLPLWLRLVVGIGVLLVATWSLMIYLAYAQQRGASIAQARAHAESANQMTVAALTGMMITGVVKDRAVYLDQIRNARDITDIRVFRARPVIDQYGPGAAAEHTPSAEEAAAMTSGRPSFVLDGRPLVWYAAFTPRSSSTRTRARCTRSSRS